MPLRVGPTIDGARLAGLLTTYLRDQAVRPFVWGTSDCWLFFADWVQLATGVDLADDIRGTYTDRRGAARHSGGNIVAAIERRAHRAGLVAVSPADARPGDVAVVQGERGVACAIRTRIGWAMRDEQRLFVVPVADSELARVWSLPRG